METVIKGIISVVITTSCLILLNSLAVKVSGADLNSKSLAQERTFSFDIQQNTNKAYREPVAVALKKPQMTQDQIKKRICEVFGSQCKNALIIAQHESSFNPKALSYTDDYGVMQVNCGWHAAKVGGDCTKLYDVETNLRVAKQIYDDSGWKAWATEKFLYY
jgi:hypothetical protein